MSSEPARVTVMGGSGTVGGALCRELAQQGARVAATYHQGEDAARALESEVGARIAKLDLSDLDAVGPVLEGLADELGGVDALVNAAAVTSTCDPPRFDALADVSVDGMRRLMDINVLSALFACRALAPRLRGGNVVLLGSVDGIKPIPTTVPYAVSKAALRGLAMSLCKELGGDDIRANLVAFGVLEEGASRALPEELKQEFLRHAGLRRFGRLAEVTTMVAWFALANSYVTGQTILVDGGL